MSAPTPTKTGRGGLAVLFAKIYFILVGLIQQVLLKRFLGLEGYGALSTALSASGIVYSPITQASLQGVSREIAQADPSSAPFVFRGLLRVHALAALGFGLSFFAFAGVLARLLGADHIALPFRILGVVLFTYGLYTPLVGALNGQKRFIPQAGLDILATTLRTGGMLAGAYFWMQRSSSAGGVTGALAGFALSSISILVVAFFVTGIGKRGPTPVSARRYLSVLLPIFGGQFVLNLLFQADALLLRRFASDAALVAGLAPTAADPIIGAYRGAQLFCFLPYQLLMSVTLILFPLLATAHKTGRHDEVGELLRSGIRLATIIAGLFASVLVALPGPLLRLLFGEEAAVLGADAMRILSVGLCTFAVLGVMTTAQNSLGGERSSLRIIALGFVLVVVLCFGLTRGVALGQTLLVRTALATSLGLGAATVFAAYSLGEQAGPVFHLRSLLKILAATSISATVGSFLRPTHPIFILAAAAVPVALYLGILVLFRELTSADLTRIRGLGAKEKPAERP